MRGNIINYIRNDIHILEFNAVHVKLILFIVI